MPEDDGAADGLEGRELPALRLEASGGDPVDLREAAADTLVLYVYPRTGVPGEPLPEGWDEIPGARGCTHPVFPPDTHAADVVAWLRQAGA